MFVGEEEEETEFERGPNRPHYHPQPPKNESKIKIDLHTNSGVMGEPNPSFNLVQYDMSEFDSVESDIINLANDVDDVVEVKIEPHKIDDDNGFIVHKVVKSECILNEEIVGSIVAIRDGLLQKPCSNSILFDEEEEVFGIG